MRQILGIVAATGFLTLACVLGSAPAQADPLPGQAEERRLISDRLNVTLGGYRPNFNTDVAAGFGGLLGAFINVERQLGMQEDLNVFRLDGFYRFKPKHAIDWTYNVLNRDGASVIDERIEFGDPPKYFEIGAELYSKFNSTLFAVSYKYSFVNNGKLDAGVSAGLFTYKYDFELTGSAVVSGDPGAQEEIATADARVIAPLPAFGIFIDYAFRKNVVFRGSVRSLNLEFGDFTGKFMDTRFTLDWYFYKHLGIGVGAARTSINFQDDGDDPFRVDYDYGGFMYYLSIVF